MPLPTLKDLNPEKCNIWEQNKNINPITNREIQTNGNIYKLLKKYCDTIEKVETKIERTIPIKNPVKKTNLRRKLTEEDCNKWNLNRFKNPITNYTIKNNSKIYEEIESTCSKLIKKDEEKKVDIPIEKIKKKDKTIIEIEPKEKKKDLKEFELYYPDLDDEKFREKLSNRYEFKMFQIPPFDNIKSLEDFNKQSQIFCGTFEKAYYQYLMGQYISTRTPYKSLLIYHSVGVGKSCSAITIAESLLVSHSIYDEPKIWVVMPLALKNSFKGQIFNTLKLQDFSKISTQCTGNTYVNLAQITSETPIDKVHQRIKKLINSRYRLFTYDSFATFIENEYLLKGLTINDKTIIIDEAHNIRSSELTDKRIYTNLEKLIGTGENNRLILLSATPMYNEPTDIFDLLSLLVLNDKRDIKFPKIYEDNKLNQEAVKIFKKLANNYISYLAGKNPFSFAFKLSPKESNIKILDKVIKNDINGNLIDKNDINWLSLIKDGIIPSQLGKNQIEYLKKDKTNILNALQPMNIVYDDEIGERGFYKFFNRINANEPLSLKYNDEYKLALSSENNLDKYASKFKKIADIIKNSNGIVIIYSSFIWSGILPMAIVLEHMGFNRSSEVNFLEKPTLNKERPKYDNIKTPNYCILSSDKREIMGGTTIDNLLKIINSPMNVNGSLIKVILMTPVASEGLSFSNIREIHLLEPWYHFNKVDQIIGRGIRNCSHQLLDIKDKNVTVFMHAGIDGYENETPDINAYRIASRKLNQTYQIDKIIRDSAIDCSLMYNINYFSKKLFKQMEKLDIITSQNKHIKYNLGDNEDLEPLCNIKEEDIDYRGFREESYNNFITSIINKLRNIILEKIHNGYNFLNYDEINNNFNKINNELIMNAISKSIYPNSIIDGYLLIPHENGIHIIQIEKFEPINIKIISAKEKEEDKKEEISNIPDKCIKKMMKYKDNIPNAIISLYMCLDQETFIFIVKKIIESNNLTEIEKFISNCLYKEGALIANNELKSVTSKTKKYLGYCNIFSDNFDPILYSDSKYRDFNDKQIAELITMRKKIEIPNMNIEKAPWGIIIPEKTKKSNVFKLLTAGSSIGKKTGIACTSLKKNEHAGIFKQINLDDENDNTKITYCNKIAVQLLKLNRISLNPEYKPTIKL